MRNPEEIKRGLEQCAISETCVKCPYYGEKDCAETMEADALTYIKQLEAGIERVYTLTKALEIALKGGEPR